MSRDTCDMLHRNFQNNFFFWFLNLATKQFSSQSYVTRYDHISKKNKRLITFSIATSKCAYNIKKVVPKKSYSAHIFFCSFNLR